MDRSQDLVLIRELVQQLEDSLFAGVQARADSFGRERFGRFCKEFENPCLAGVLLLQGCGSLGSGNQPEAGSIAGILGADQLESQGTQARGRAVFDQERPTIAAALEKQKAIRPCVDIGRASEAVARAEGELFSAVVHQRDGYAERTLQGTEVAKQGGHGVASVFIGGMNADQGIQDQESGPVAGNGGLEPFLMLALIQAEQPGGNHVYIERVEVDPAISSEGLQARV
jgi:hypothetical protein